jgi:hypothetical protein
MSYARRLVRHLERLEPDAHVAAADIGVESVVRPRVDAAVAEARAAVGRHLVGVEAERRRERRGAQRE